MQFPKLKAVCQDCLKLEQTPERIRIESLVGPLSIVPDKLMSSTMDGTASGLLLLGCASHHSQYKIKNGPNHSQFKVYGEDGSILGHMGATTEASKVAFWVENGLLRSNLSREAMGSGSPENR